MISFVSSHAALCYLVPDATNQNHSLIPNSFHPTPEDGIIPDNVSTSTVSGTKYNLRQLLSWHHVNLTMYLPIRIAKSIFIRES